MIALNGVPVLGFALGDASPPKTFGKVRVIDTMPVTFVAGRRYQLTMRSSVPMSQLSVIDPDYLRDVNAMYVAYQPSGFHWRLVSTARPDPNTRVNVYDQPGPTVVFDTPRTLDVAGSATVTLSDVQDIGETPSEGMAAGAKVAIGAGVIAVGGLALWLAVR